MWAVELCVSAIDFFREYYGVAIVGLCYKGDSLNGFEISGFCKSDADAELRISTIRYVPGAFERCDSRVLYAELFIFIERLFFSRCHKRLRPGFEIEAVITLGYPDYGAAGLEM